MTGDPWYAGGLRFECRRCGACCTGEPGYVYLRRGEAEAAARSLGMTAARFRRRYTRQADGRVSLREEADGRCVFFADGVCRIYAVRPLQCRTFPFWRWNVECREHWEEIAEECPGIGRGRLFTLDEIRERLRRKVG